MTLKTWFKGYILIATVILIGVLLLANIYLIHQNSLLIEKNKNLQEEAESIKVKTIDITRNLHLVDMSVRSFALVNKHRFYASVDSAFNERKRIFASLEVLLKRQNFPMEEFYPLRDSVAQYFVLVDTMRNYIIQNKQKEFLVLLNEDLGYPVWLKYSKFANHITLFENRIVEQAKTGYQRAVSNIYWLQIILFLITMPTLGYSAYYALQALRISERLRKSEEDNSHILAEQKAKLEQLVLERTSEIQEAKQIIQDQNIKIQKQNEELLLEVNKQTRDIKLANLELIEQNNRLEQFNYIISHNVRSPLARLLGLASIFSHAQEQTEIVQIIDMMVGSTADLDQVIKDLAYILEVQQVNTQLLSRVNLHDVLDKAKQRLDQHIKRTNAQIIVKFTEPIILNSLPAYLDSIFYNLVSNAIKYRHPERLPVITIEVEQQEKFVQIDVIDNGLGIDLEKYGDKLFTLYKRFHFHVEGKGLGLFLIKTQINTLGGKIEVQSKVEEGSTFSVYLKNDSR